MSEDAEISNKILELINNKSPETVEKLIEIVDQELDIPRDIALKQVIELENEGKLRLSSPPESIPKEFKTYLFSIHASWFWVIMAMSTATAIAIFTIHENAIPYVYIRYILGSIFLLLLPGYSLIITLFPTREIDNIERIALSIGVSLALVPLIGLVLNYTPWGIRLTPIFLSLLAITTILSITGIIREHQTKISEDRD